jgi:hypothetical protein
MGRYCSFWYMLSFDLAARLRYTSDFKNLSHSFQVNVTLLNTLPGRQALGVQAERLSRFLFLSCYCFPLKSMSSSPT